MRVDSGESEEWCPERLACGYLNADYFQTDTRFCNDYSRLDTSYRTRRGYRRYVYTVSAEFVHYFTFHLWTFLSPVLWSPLRCLHLLHSCGAGSFSLWCLVLAVCGVCVCVCCSSALAVWFHGLTAPIYTFSLTTSSTHHHCHPRLFTVGTRALTSTHVLH